MAENENTTETETSQQPASNEGALREAQEGQAPAGEQLQADGTFKGEKKPRAEWKGIRPGIQIQSDNAADGVCEFLSGAWMLQAMDALVSYVEAVGYSIDKMREGKEALNEMKDDFAKYRQELRDILNNRENGTTNEGTMQQGTPTIEAEPKKQKDEPKKQKEEPAKQKDEPKKQKEEPAKQKEEPKKQKDGQKKKKKKNKNKSGKKARRNKRKNKNKNKNTAKAKTEKKTLKQQGKDAQNRKNAKANKTKAGQQVGRKKAKHRDSLRNLNSAQKAIRNRNNRAKARSNNRTMARAGGKSGR